jgi:hypothetical protein
MDAPYNGSGRIKVASLQLTEERLYKMFRFYVPSCMEPVMDYVAVQFYSLRITMMTFV